MTDARLAVARVKAVVIGGSAGAIDALLALLPALTPTSRSPIFIVVHLRRERESMLPQVFAPHCARPIKEAEDKEAVLPGTVYLAVPDYHLQLDEGPRISLSYDEPINWSRPSIDALFASAADVYGEGLLAVLLSGGNQDGSAGLRAVHERGGLTVVQHPDSASCPTMPNEAIRLSAPDSVLDIAGMKSLLQALS